MGKKKGKKGKKGPPPPPPTAEDETPTLPIPKDVVQLPSPSCFGNYSANIHTVGKHKFLAIVHQFRGQIVLPEKRAHPHTCWFRAGPPAKAATICISEDGEQTPYDPGFGSVAVPSCETCREIASDTEGAPCGARARSRQHWVWSAHWPAGRGPRAGPRAVRLVPCCECAMHARRRGARPWVVPLRLGVGSRGALAPALAGAAADCSRVCREPRAHAEDHIYAAHRALVRPDARRRTRQRRHA